MSRKRRGRGEGSVFQRANGMWCASVSNGYTGEGKRRRKWVYGPTKSAVMDKLKEIDPDAAGVPAEKQTVQQWLDYWLENIVKPTARATTHLRYTQSLASAKEQIGGVQLTKLTGEHVESMWAAMKKAGASDDKRRKTGIVLGTAMEGAIEAKRIKVNPVRSVAKKSKPRPKRKEIQPLDVAGVATFLAAAATDRLYAMYLLAIDSGMRQGELFALEWADIDWQGSSVQVRHNLQEVKGKLSLQEPKTKTGKRRVTITPSTLAALREHQRTMLAAGFISGPVFCDTEGKWLRKSNVQRGSFQPILERAKVTIRFHDLRHTTASLLLMANTNPKVVQERLGHARVEITLNTYSHTLGTMQGQAAGTMEGLLNPPKKTAETSS